MKKKNRLFKTVILVLAGVILLTLALAASRTRRDASDNVRMGMGWKVVFKDGPQYPYSDLATLKFPLAQNGDVITLSCVLPDVKTENPILEFYCIHAAISVELEDLDGGIDKHREVIYQYGLDDYENNRVVGSGFHYITLPDDFARRLFIITLYVSEDNAFGNIEVPTICNGKNAFGNFVRIRSIPLVIILSLPMLGICFFFVGIIMFFKSKQTNLISVSLFSILIGIWALCSSDLLPVFTDNLRLRVFLEFGSLYFAPCFIMTYFRDECLDYGGKLRKFGFHSIWGLLMSFAAVTTILQVFNIVHFPKVLTIAHVLMALMGGYLVVVLVADAKKHRADNYLIFVGLIIALTFAMTDLVRYNLKKFFAISASSHFTSTVYIGAFVLMLAMIIDYSDKVLAHFYKMAENATLEKLAYVDSLTGLSNRRRFQEKYDVIDHEKEDYAIISFDLNGLKKVNDNLGHEMGDKYLKTFAGFLKASFSKEVILTRTGGDEFAAILKGRDMMDADKSIETLLKKIQQSNVGNEDWQMSTAYGIAYSTENGLDNVHAVFSAADARMYELKHKMKEQQQ